MILSPQFAAPMKAALFILLIGVIVGALGWRYYQRTQNPPIGQRVGNLADKAREKATDAREVAGKAEDLKLTPENIKDELARTGRVARTKARGMGEIIGDARIIAVIKGKYVVDSSLSALAITVDCQDGAVKLTGSATTPENIGRAVTLALHTHGVSNVVSHLVVKS